MDGSNLPVAPPAPDRRLYRRYAIGLGAQVMGPGWTLTGHVIDLSLGGACFVHADEAAAPVEVAQEVDVRCAGIGRERALPAIVRRFASGRLYLAFILDAPAEDALTLFLMASPATLEAAG